ncbi:MAG: NB-ARC domain-containing protein [Pseudonocardiales bacterium]
MGEEQPGTHNRFDGEAATVFQARDVYGGVHYHDPQRRIDPPRQVLPPPEHYTNNEPQLAALSRILAHRHDDDGPKVAIIRGAPGSGRSTLATTWVHQHRGDYPDGHFVIRLASGGDSAERVRAVLADLLATLGFSESQVPASLDGRVGLWRSWSAGKRVAMVIDDAVVPSQVRELLPGQGRSVAVVTEAGRLTGLQAKVSARYVTVDPLSPESARLLLSRMVGPERIAAEPGAVAELINRCDGSAIALCVVGAMLAEFDDRPTARLAATLASDERLLPELSRDENLSLTVVFDAAYRRLDPLAQACYRLVGVHPGGGDVAVDTVAAVLGEQVGDVADAFGNLRRAVLAVETTQDRYLVPGLLAHHARAMTGQEESERLRRRIVAFYRNQALAASLAWMPTRGWLQQLWPELSVSWDGLDNRAARRWMEAERANLRAAVEAACALGELAWVCQFGIALWPLHDQGKYSHDMVAVNKLGVDVASTLGEDLAAALLGLQQGFAHRQRNELDRAVELFAAARRSAVGAGSLTVEATAVESLGLARLDQGRRPEAAELLAHNLALAERIGERRRLALARFHLAKVEPPATALAMLDLARAGLEALPSSEAYTLVKVELWRAKKLIEDGGRPAEAAELLADASAAAVQGGWHLERAQICEALADLALSRDDPAVASSHLRDALDIYRLRGFTAQAVAAEYRLAELE